MLYVASNSSNKLGIYTFTLLFMKNKKMLENKIICGSSNRKFNNYLVLVIFLDESEWDILKRAGNWKLEGSDNTAF